METNFVELVENLKAHITQIDKMDLSLEEQLARKELWKVANSFVSTYSLQDLEQYNVMCPLRKDEAVSEKKSIELITLPEKVYAPWAFTEYEQDKRDVNKNLYKKICHMARVEYVSTGYAHKIMKVLPLLEFKQELLNQGESEYLKRLALIADEGNLCFGFAIESGNKDSEEVLVKIFTD